MSRTTPARPSYTVSPLGSLETARDTWKPLADVNGNLFGTWEWAWAWWSVYSRGRQAHIYAAGPPGQTPRAVLPLYSHVAHPVPLWRFIGDGPADMLGPVCAPADRADTAEALRSLVDTAPGRAVAVRVDGGDGWASLLGARTLRRQACPVLDVGERSWDEWLASKSKNFREQVRRRERSLSRKHGLQFRLITGEPGRREALNTLIALHDARWNNGSRVFSPDRRRFMERFTALAARQGWLRLWTAELDGRPAAAWLGFRFGGADWYYAAGRDPAWAQASVGFVLFMRTIRDAFEAGSREYRMLLGAEPFKQRISTTDRGLETIVVGRGPLPGLMTMLAGAARKLPAAGKDRLAERLQGVRA